MFYCILIKFISLALKNYCSTSLDPSYSVALITISRDTTIFDIAETTMQLRLLLVAFECDYRHYQGVRLQHNVTTTTVILNPTHNRICIYE